MSKPKTNLRQNPIAMVAVLVVLAIVIAIRVPGLLPDKGSPARAAEISGEMVNEELSPPGDLLAISEEAASYRKIVTEDPERLLPASSRAMTSGTILRNPFRESGNGEEQSTAVKTKRPSTRTKRIKLKCSAIFLDGKNPNALINGKILGVGDRIGDYRVAKIDAAGVDLRRQGKSLRLKLEGRKSGGGPSNLVYNTRQEG